ncbi:MerR family transcriptional regulator, partial [Ruminococcaceae bacterium OttesenSCG-928-I18]|nr:MerR family transcriptional regulator [Ruminococcaceae bacterium OttesenSCG-928-I18]
MKISKVRKKAEAGLALTTYEVAMLMGVCHKTVINYEKRGLVPDCVTPTGQRRYWPETVDRFMDK